MTYPEHWEYQSLLLKGDLVACLNKAGADGWQFCAVLEVVRNDAGLITAHGVLMQRPKRLIVTDTRSAPVDLLRGPTA